MTNHQWFIKFSKNFLCQTFTLYRIYNYTFIVTIIQHTLFLWCMASMGYKYRHIIAYHLTFLKKLVSSNFLAHSFIVTSYLESSTSSPMTWTNPQDLWAMPYKKYKYHCLYVHKNVLWTLKYPYHQWVLLIRLLTW